MVGLQPFDLSPLPRLFFIKHILIMDKTDVSHVEVAHDPHRDTDHIGQIELLRNNKVVLIPTPSADPRGMFS